MAQFTFQKWIMMGGLTLAGQTAMGQSYHWEDARERVRPEAWMHAHSVETQSGSVPVFVRLPDRLHRVPDWSFTFQGVKLPLYDLAVPDRDLYDRDTYRSYIDGSRVIKTLEFKGYSDIEWFSFREEVRLAQKCDGVLLGTKDGGRQVLAGVRVVTE